MRKVAIAFSVIFIFCISKSSAQFSRYIIRLKDKAGNNFTAGSPSQFLSQRAIDRRTKYNIPVDETDLPITQAYIDSIISVGNVTILNVSKWLNQVCIQTTDGTALAKINSFSFVLASSPVAARLGNKTTAVNKQPDAPNQPVANENAQKPQGTKDYYNYGQSYAQVHLNNTDFLHNHGFRGDGMQLSIMDAGFYHYQSLPTFDSMRNNGQVLNTWDFVAGEPSVNEDFAHGMNCLSTIAANLPGIFVGTAPKSSFYLFRTEDANSEYPVEEQNFAAAAERADSAGADVFSVSLGYNTFDDDSFDYTYADMDGNTSLIAKAADAAAKKGILVVVAAGNTGNDSWHYITTPADADSVLAIGAVDVNRQAGSFSAYGPSGDGQVKPDVAAVGVNAVVASSNTGNPSFGSGTSYACPILAGTATCLWQAFPEVNNMAIIDALRRSADKYTAPDNRTGYGIADAKKAFVLLVKKLYSQQITISDSCKAELRLSVKTAAGMDVVIERKLPGEADYTAISTQNPNAAFAAATIVYKDDLHALPNNTALQYRIKMSIGTDTTFYLDSATVNYTQSCTAAADDIKISPNPVTDGLSVIITRSTPVNAAIEVYAANGQKIYSIANQQVTGSRAFIVPMKKLSKGIYFVAVFIDHKKNTTKQVIR